MGSWELSQDTPDQSLIGGALRKGFLRQTPRRLSRCRSKRTHRHSGKVIATETPGDSVGPTCVTAPAGERTGREREGRAPAEPLGLDVPVGWGSHRVLHTVSGLRSPQGYRVIPPQSGHRVNHGELSYRRTKLWQMKLKRDGKIRKQDTG